MQLMLATDDAGGPELFASVQGEGPSAGRPVAFIRLSRCNLACVWCDTAYTWRFEGDERPHRSDTAYDRRANQVGLDAEEAARRILALGQDRLVVTGGEPTLQTPALVRLLEALPRTSVEIETNGTSLPSPALDARIDQYNVSPKLSHSGNPANLALRGEALRFYAECGRAFFKFVVATPGDVAEALDVVERFGLAKDRTFLMPEGTDGATLRARQEWLVPLCLKHGLRLTDRLHIHLFGDTRGT